MVDIYLERFVKVERPERERAFRWQLDAICRTMIADPRVGERTFGDFRLTDIVTDTIELFRERRRTAGTGPTGTNRYLGALRAVFNWAVRVGYVETSPFRRGTEPVVKLSREEKRGRRLNADIDEEDKLLAACGPHLRAVVECALETGMRRGEILSLQWSQVIGLVVEENEDAPPTLTWATRPEILLPATKTKTRRDRRIPISGRLRGILELRRLDPNAVPLPPDAYVFGNAIGQQVKDIKRAWMTALLKAHGHKAVYTKGANLDDTSRLALHAINLRLHDLRREAGSRWLEGGVPLHTVRDWLGHTNVSQTSTYLAGTIKTQHDAMTAFEARRAALQPIATDAGTGGRKRPRSAEARNTTPSKNAGDRDSRIM